MSGIAARVRAKARKGANATIQKRISGGTSSRGGSKKKATKATKKVAKKTIKKAPAKKTASKSTKKAPARKAPAKKTTARKSTSMRSPASPVSTRRLAMPAGTRKARTAEKWLEAATTEHSASLEVLFDDANGFRKAMARAKDDRERVNLFATVDEDLKEHLQEFFVKDGNDKWTLKPNAGSATPSAITPATSTAAFMGAKVVDGMTLIGEEGKYRVTDGGIDRPIWEQFGGVWTRVGQFDNDVDWLNHISKAKKLPDRDPAHDLTAACELKLGIRNAGSGNKLIKVAKGIGRALSSGSDD